MSQGNLNLAAMAVANREVGTLKHSDSRDKLVLVAVNSIGEEHAGSNNREHHKAAPGPVFPAPLSPRGSGPAIVATQAQLNNFMNSSRT
jgi:hypothetical protein